MSDVVVRQAEESDGEQVRALALRSADSGRIAFRTVHRASVAEVARARRPGAATFVAVAPDGRVVGAASATPYDVVDGDRTARLVWLHSLGVDPEWRRRGIASRLTGARLAHAETLPGPTVVAAAIQSGNEASMAGARRWSDRTLGTVRVTPVPPPRRAPRPVPGLEVRPAGPGDLETVATGIRSTARDLALAPVTTADELAAWLAVEVNGVPVHEYVVAVDAAGTVVAGLGIEDEGSVQALEIVALPLAVRAANLALRVVPHDRMMRNLNVRLPFVTPGQEAAARHLWQSVRWRYRERGSSVVTAFAPGSPVARALRSPAWLPSTGLDVVVRDHPEVALPAGPPAPWV